MVIDKSTFTRELVEASGEFVLCVPSRARARLALQVGAESGREVDKFAVHDIRYAPGNKVGMSCAT